MALQIEENTKPVLLFGDSLFSTSKTDITFAKSYYNNVPPTNAISKSNKISFNLPALPGKMFYNLKEMLMCVRVKILKRDGTKPGPGDVVTTVNNPLHSLFQSVSLSINNCVVTPNSNYYAHRAYFKTLLGFDKLAKETGLELLGYAKDIEEDGFKMNTKNKGAIKRLKFFATLTEETEDAQTKYTIVNFFEDGACFVGRLMVDLPELPLINGLQCSLTFELNSDEFFLMGDSDALGFKYKFEIENFNLLPLIHECTDPVYEAIAKKFETESIHYPFYR